MNRQGKCIVVADIKTKTSRSYNMSQIKCKNTKPEELVRKYLFAEGFRYRKNDKRYPGSPDVVLPKYKTVIFVNGCFWHGHNGCKSFVWPSSNEEFWRNKITTNIERDTKKIEQLRSMDWNVITVWECELKPKQRTETLARLVQQIREQVDR